MASEGLWDGDFNVESDICRFADASYKRYHDSCATVGGPSVFLQNASIENKVQQSRTPFTKYCIITEAQLVSGTNWAQDALLC